MPFTFTANPVDSLIEAQLNFEQIAAILGGGPVGDVLTADAHGNASWASPAADSGWLTFTYANGWTNGSDAAYRSIGNAVLLRGLVIPGSAGTIATLPVGVRPANTRTFPVLLASGVFAYVQVSAAGTVGSSSTASSVYLDPIAFRVD